MAKLNVLQNEISIISVDGQDYISLTDMANARTDDARAADVIKNWIRNRYTIELLGTWEIIHNPDFKVVEFDHFKSQAGLPSFVMSVSDWVEKTNAIGLVVRKFAFFCLVELGAALLFRAFRSTRGKVNPTAERRKNQNMSTPEHD